MIDFGKLTRYVMVEAALDELFLVDIGHAAYVPPDVDW